MAYRMGGINMNPLDMAVMGFFVLVFIKCGIDFWREF